MSLLNIFRISHMDQRLVYIARIRAATNCSIEEAKSIFAQALALQRYSPFSLDGAVEEAIRDWIGPTIASTDLAKAAAELADLAHAHHCPTCGSPVRVVGSGEGTMHYKPITKESNG